MRPTVLLLALIAASPTPAHAQQAPTSAQLAQAKDQFTKGRQLYDAGDKSGAVERFKEAYKLSKNPVLLYNIAFVYDELGDRALALHYYEKFLMDAPDVKKTKANRQLASERVPALKQEIANEEKAAAAAAVAAAAAARAAAAPAAPGAPPAAPPVTEFTHTPIDETPPHVPLDVIARIPPGVAWKLTVFYRPAGHDEYTAVKMEPRFAEIVGRIPATATAAANVQYYVEVRDEAGRLVASSGKASSPNLVAIERRARPHYYRDLSERGSGYLVGADAQSAEEAAAARVPRVAPEPIRPLTYAKWATTGGSIALFGAAAAFYFTARSSASSLENEATSSRDPASGTCTSGLPPCAQYSDYHKALEESGKRYELLTNVALVAGAATAVAAGTLWWLDHGAASRRREKQATTVTPVVSQGFVGGAAQISF